MSNPGGRTPHRSDAPAATTAADTTAAAHGAVPREPAVAGDSPNDAEVPTPPSGADDSPLRAALSVVTTIGPPLTIATALMIYFGWARSDTQARAMGLDVSLFGFSKQDYLLLSISTLYVPLLVLATLALVVLALHRRVDRALRRPTARPALRTAGRVALAVGLVVSGVAVLAAAVGVDRATLVIPLALAGGTAVAAYGDWLAGAARDRDTPVPVIPVWQRALRLLLIGSVITMALFWEVSNFASVVGRGYAQQIESTVPRLPRVTAFSAASLGIEAPGVREERIAGSPSTGPGAVRYRTTGLRLLVSSGGRMFLLHDGWRARSGTVIVLPDNEEVRWQFSR
jgi:uncharacterized membrane protein YidH (DUF202 family)